LPFAKKIPASEDAGYNNWTQNLRISTEPDGFKEKRFAPPFLLKRMVIAGWNGKKNGKGFYDWTDPKGPVPQDAALRGLN
jgi:3-hydroxyacyl-CoA dehydrogenase